MVSGGALRQSVIELGYRPTDVVAGYRFAAIDQPGRSVHTVEVAAFLDVPASYKTAALAVVQTSANDFGPTEVAAHRSLGAPFLIVLSEQTASAWTYAAEGPRKVKESPASNWHELLHSPELDLRPSSVRELKTVRVRDADQGALSLFDPSMLYAVQAQTQVAVHEMLQEFLAHFEGRRAHADLSLTRDFQVLFPLVFRLLAGKILVDRDDARVDGLEVADATAVVARIGELYSLDPLNIRWNDARRRQLKNAWDALREGLFVRNVAAEDLAFVYENTLISPDVRQKYGTHSTPSSVADYVVRSLDLPAGKQAEDVTVFEPFAGSCVFLTAALRRFKELLPADWSPTSTHDHVVKRFRASEIDPFACELARLSLVLADYPNNNGWKICNEDLFADGVLLQRCKDAQVVICNPPFEDFEGGAGAHSIHKPLAALETILEARPEFVGVVMPSGFSTHKKYRAIIEQATRSYQDVELLMLPEGTFSIARVGAEVLIAQHPRSADDSQPVRLRHSVIDRGDFDRFQSTLKPSRQEVVFVDPKASPGLVGLKPLRDLWAELARYPRLSSIADIHRGLEWNVDQSLASKATRSAGFKPGLHRIGGSIDQFRILERRYLNCRAEDLRGGAINLPWAKPKVICNAVRKSRGHWRLAAAVDTEGLLVSQQYFGIWLKHADQSSSPLNVPLVALACVLNSPLASAYSYCHNHNKGLTIETMDRLPLPTSPIAASVVGLVREYVDAASGATDGPLFDLHSRPLAEILLEIDATVLAAYDLPPRLERELLRFMSEGHRSAPVSFTGYPGTEPGAGAISLIHRLPQNVASRAAAWNVIRQHPLDKETVELLDLI
ncbi:MAG: N-6 DNA methylase [Methylotenera sp.]|nr:N-6 DNA methylase [Methylotenera sp.]